ncbi:hypothetical protein GDO81_023483, partial [Engystomops pustulosus]
LHGDTHSSCLFQIQDLPDKDFWRQFKNLKLLYLHDNRIRSVDHVESLSSCPNLTGLTLYDTPLSLHKSYRHMAVNSLWSLKALDHFVVSDEEIIEDWNLQGKFKALSPDLHMNMLPASGKDFSPENEMKALNEIIRKINGVLATCSPVLIVQKWIRGYLVRRRMGLIPKLEMKTMRLHYGRRGSLEVQSSPCVEAAVLHNFWDLPLTRRRLPVIKQTHIGNKVLPEAEIVYDLGNQNQRPPPITEGLHGEKRAKDVTFTAAEHGEQGHPDPEQNSEGKLGLFGKKVMVHESDPSKDNMILNERSAEDIRCAIQQIHSTVQAKREGANLIKDQSTTRRTGDSGRLMKLLPLCAVDKAYENREKHNSQIKKRNLVLKIQDDRRRAKDNIDEFLGDKVKDAVDQDARDSQILQQQVQNNFLDSSNSIDKVKQRHRLFCNQKEAKRSEYLLAKEFNIHHLSVAKTLLRHDRMIRSQEEMKEKIRLVQNVREDEDGQKEFMKCLQEHRQLLLQIENASEKATLGSLVLQKSNDRLHEARARVTATKGQRVTAQAMCKVAVKQPVTKGTPQKHGRT